jgi:hypothetical protein
MGSPQYVKSIGGFGLVFVKVSVSTGGYVIDG